MRRNPTRQWLILACATTVGTAVQVQADYASQVQALGPVHYWRLNDKATIPAADVAANTGSLGAAATGFYVGAASHPLPGALKSGSDTAAGFDATPGTAVAVPYTAALNPNGPFTVEFWANPNANTTTAAPTCVVSSGQFASPRSGWLIYQIDTGWSFRMYNQNGTATSVNLNAGTAPEIGAWYHVVAVYDGAQALLYVNGALA